MAAKPTSQKVNRPINDPPFIDTSFYTIAQFAEAMDISTRTVRDWIADGSLKAVKFKSGRGKRLRGAILNQFVAECESEDA